MNSASQVLDPIPLAVAARRGNGRRMVTLLAMVCLLGAALVIARDAGTPTVPDEAPAVAQVTDLTAADAGAPATLTSQIHFPPLQHIICPILNHLGHLPFVGAIINFLRVLFGCISP